MVTKKKTITIINSLGLIEITPNNEGFKAHKGYG